MAARNEDVGRIFDLMPQVRNEGSGSVPPTKTTIGGDGDCPEGLRCLQRPDNKLQYADWMYYLVMSMNHSFQMQNLASVKNFLRDSDNQQIYRRVQSCQGPCPDQLRNVVLEFSKSDH